MSFYEKLHNSVRSYRGIRIVDLQHVEKTIPIPASTFALCSDAEFSGFLVV